VAAVEQALELARCVETRASHRRIDRRAQLHHLPEGARWPPPSMISWLAFAMPASDTRPGQVIRDPVPHLSGWPGCRTDTSGWSDGRHGATWGCARTLHASRAGVGEMDITWRRLLREVPESVLRLVFPGRRLRVVGPASDASVDRPRQLTTDKLFVVRDGRRELMLHVEIELE
jgi:hypothetical protein